MNYSEILTNSLKKQGIDMDIKEIPFNLFLKNSDDVLLLCFIEYEDDKCLVVAETNDKGFEELRIVPKSNIEYISVFYDFNYDENEEKTDKMII